jgi:hypothetical protein
MILVNSIMPQPKMGLNGIDFVAQENSGRKEQTPCQILSKISEKIHRGKNPLFFCIYIILYYATLIHESI